IRHSVARPRRRAAGSARRGHGLAHMHARAHRRAVAVLRRGTPHGPPLSWRSNDMSENRDSTLPVRIWRGDANGRFERYDVPRHPSQTILDVVSHVQQHVDPTLAYRFACRVGMCGSCAMTVNGKARWTCRTHVDAVAANDVLEIAPLSHLPIVRDLVVDMTPFFDKWAAAKGSFSPTASRTDELAR